MSTRFFDKEDYSVEDLQKLIQDQIEESINLDYKSAKSLDKSDSKKREIAKDISAFANSDGGIIIYGMQEENHKPISIDFADGELFNKEWLENVIDSNIQQKIQGIRIFPIRIDSNIKKTVYVVKIPASSEAPHISADKKFYRRYNFKSVPMEEYEVKLLYSRTSKAEIDFHSFLRNNIEEYQANNGRMEISCDYEIHIINTSNSIEKHCKVEAAFANIEGLKVGFSYLQQSNIKHHTSIEKGQVLSAYNDSPIFPDEIYSILKFSLKIDKLDYADFEDNASLDLKLYDSSGIKTTEYKINELKRIESKE